MCVLSSASSVLMNQEAEDFLAINHSSQTNLNALSHVSWLCYNLIVKPPQNIKTSIQRLNLVLCSLILYVVQVSQIEVFQCWHFFEQTLTSIVNVLFWKNLLLVLLVNITFYGMIYSLCLCWHYIFHWYLSVRLVLDLCMTIFFVVFLPINIITVLYNAMLLRPLQRREGMLLCTCQSVRPSVYNVFVFDQ